MGLSNSKSKLIKCEEKIYNTLEPHNISGSVIQETIDYLSTDTSREETVNKFIFRYNRTFSWRVDYRNYEDFIDFEERRNELMLQYFKINLRNYPKRNWQNHFIPKNIDLESIEKYEHFHNGHYGFAALIHKNNIVGNELNHLLTEHINKLKIICDDYREFKNHNKIQNILDPLLNTNKYWIPSLFYIDNNYNVDIKSEINNLPKIQHAALYGIIARIFSKMVPLFEYLVGVSLQNELVQVIVDIQNYIIQPSTEYNGNVHREGYKDGEGVEICGIYYFDKTNNCFDDDIFEITNTISDPCAVDQTYSKCIDVNKHCCIVFNNNVINHRLFKLVNKSKDKIGERSILNFFLPKYKINTTQDTKVNILPKTHFIVNHWIRTFNNNSNKYNEFCIMQIPQSIGNLIMAFTVNTKENRNKRNELREERLRGIVLGENGPLIQATN